MRLPLAPPPPESRPFDALGFGLNSIDLVAVVAEHPQPDSKQRIQRFARLPGGQAATAMVACARLGWRARYVGSFGDDDHGRLGSESLASEGVDTSACRVVAGATNQFALVLVDARSGARTVLWDRHPALAMTPADVPREAIESARVVLVDCHDTAASTEAARMARAAGQPTVVDVEKVRTGIADLLREIDIIIAARDFPSELTGHGDLGRALAAMAAEYDAALVCVTLGEEGSLALARGREIRTRGYAVPAVDTTGAGDVFRGGFVAGWLAQPEGDVEDILEAANAAAALNCRALGARGAIPRREELEALLERGRGIKPLPRGPV